MSEHKKIEPGQELTPCPTGCSIGVWTASLKEDPDYLAPDGSEIRLFSKLRGGGLCHCTLPPGRTSLAVAHKTVEEIWYFVQGRGQVWRKLGSCDVEVDVHCGVSLSIPVGTQFQFRNTGNVPLCFIIVTMPPWPDPSEAVRVEDHWKLASH